MALLKYVSDEAIANVQVMAIFGHLIKSNKQVHDFQYILLNDYLEIKGIAEDGLTPIRSVIFETEDAVSFEKAVALFAAESLAIRNELYILLVTVSRVDGFFDRDEGAFFERLAELCGDYSHLDYRAQRQASRLRKLLKKENSKYRSGRRSNAHDNLFRISQKEYLRTIKECRAVAVEDFQMIKPICDSTIASAEALVSKVYKMADTVANSPEDQDMAAILRGFAEKISGEILPAAKDYKLKIHQKEAAVEDFTIVLVGRTKAGKSTLKAVLTGSGKDEIGKGKQRTTLVNYIYEWNNLRIIDTPGIDAGGDVEQVDKDIAEQALAEADVVCYLTPCDGVPKGTIAFIGEIVKSNKPVLVLLNYKNNIRDEDDLEEFLEDPDEWRSDKGNNSILGYYAPIRQSAEQDGYDKMVTCYPVFLLAALMAEESRYADCATVLRRSSGIDEFLASLKIIVAEQGTFLRSKTIIDDSIGHCTAWLDDFRVSRMNIVNQIELLREKQRTTFDKIDRAKQKFIDGAARAIRQEFGELATQHARRFAQTHYRQKEGLGKSWNDYCEKIGFSKRVEEAVQVELAEFSKTLHDVFDDLTVDLGEDLRSYSAAMKTPVRFDLFPAHEVTKFVSRALGLISIPFLASPVGWILGGAALVVGFISGLFKKRADREREAQDRLYQNLRDEVEDQAEETVKKFVKNAKQEAEVIVAKTKRHYTNLLRSMESVLKESDAMCAQWEEQIERMNHRFATRVLQYLDPEAQPDVAKVNRTFGESLEIYVSSDRAYDPTKLEGLIKDRVTVIGPKDHH